MSLCSTMHMMSHLRTSHGLCICTVLMRHYSALQAILQGMVTLSVTLAVRAFLLCGLACVLSRVQVSFRLKKVKNNIPSPRGLSSVCVCITSQQRLPSLPVSSGTVQLVDHNNHLPTPHSHA